MSASKVLYNFNGKEKDMLTVKAGDFVTVLEKSENGWCTARTVGGKQGLVPSAYVEPLLANVSSLP